MDVIVRVVVAFVVVVGMMWLLAKLVKRPLRGRAGRGLEVITRTQLTRGASIAVVRMDQRALVLGVTDGGVRLLLEADAEQFGATADGGPAERTALDIDEVLVTTPEPAAKPDLVAKLKRTAKPARADSVPAGSAPGSAPGSALAGSALSPQTWRQALEMLRERSARRS